MEPFDKYAEYYNLFYNNKNYFEESDYIDRLIQKFKPGSTTILDLGCGTGQHNFFLVEKGYQVTGVDRSKTMLAFALNKKETLSESQAAKLAFHSSDVRNCRLQSKFDAVISMFHVASYQTSNEDIQQFFQTAAFHLMPGGVFIFDCWYGPGVLQDPPEARIKKVEDETVAITRTAEPVMHVHENWVDVNYKILVKDKKTHQVEEIKECHRMRYLFKPEIEMIFEHCGFKALAFMEFLKEDPPNDTSWNACFVATKK